MAKTVRLEPIAQVTSVATNDNLLSVLLNKDLDVLRECGGRGMCATCHVYVREGMEGLSPINRREQRTLEVITSCKTNSRLACQACVLKDGVVVELPSGMYINSIKDIEDWATGGAEFASSGDGAGVGGGREVDYAIGAEAD
jgi:ferredoxin